MEVKSKSISVPVHSSSTFPVNGTEQLCQAFVNAVKSFVHFDSVFWKY